jgi:penicillin-binding protein 2
MNTKNNERNVIQRWRLWILYGLMGAVFCFFAYRLFSLQVVHGKDYQAQADFNRTEDVNVQTKRGIIYDRNGFVLARNIASYNITITPAYLPDDPTVLGDSTALDTDLPSSVQEVYRKLSALIDIPVYQGEINEETVRLFKPCDNELGLTQIVYIADTNSPYTPVRVKCNVTEALAMTIRARTADLPGVGVEVEAVRDYPTGSLTATVIGFLGPVPAIDEDYFRNKGFLPGRDKVGYAGIEATMQDVLGGQNGSRLIEMDVSGKELRSITNPVDPIPGNNIQLTIDTRLQTVAQEALAGEIDYWNTRLGIIKSTSGVVIAMNPKTGEILAMVNYPSYENNRMARQIPADYYNQLGLDPNKPLFNHAISAEYPPGSVFKLPTAVGALNERVVTPDQKLNDPGKIVVTEKTMLNTPGRSLDLVCWQATGHGDMDWVHGVANSCDVYFYKIGGGYAPDNVGGLGIWRLGEYARALGYGSRTGLELPGEARGLIPDPDWKRLNQGESWTIGDTYIASMGQGLILSTPLQVLVSAEILSNNGKYMQPT